MRKFINCYLNTITDEFYFLHCDTWHFTAKYNCLNCGVQEYNMMNIASGMLLNNKTVIVYSIAGFVIEKCLEQLRLVVPNRGKLILLVAGAHHEYPEELGDGHQIEIDYISKYLEQYGYNFYDFYYKNFESAKEEFKIIFHSNENKSVILLGKE